MFKYCRAFRMLCEEKQKASLLMRKTPDGQTV